MTTALSNSSRSASTRSSPRSSITCRRSKARTMTDAWGNASSTAWSALARQFAAFIVVAEGDDLGSLRASGAKQVEPQAVAIIDLGAELARKLDLRRLLVDDGDADPLGHQHLRDGLAEAAVADDDRAGLRRFFGTVEPGRAALLAPFEPVGQPHQERRRRHRQGDDCAEQRRGLGERSSCAAVACANRTKPNSPAWLSSRPRRKLRGPASAEGAAEQRDQHRLDDDHAGGEADDQHRPCGDQASGRAAFRPTGRTARGGSSGTARHRSPARAGRGIRRASRRRRMRRARPKGAARASPPRADDGEQAGDDEQLALAEAADQPEQRIDQEAGRRGPGR